MASTIEFDDELSYGTIDRTVQNAEGYGVLAAGCGEVAAVRLRQPVPARRQLRPRRRRLHAPTASSASSVRASS